MLDQPARLLCVIVLPVLVSGCIVFFPEEPYAASDPQAAQFVKARQVDGRTLVLADGGRVDVQGIDVGGLSPFQRKREEQALANYARVNLQLLRDQRVLFDSFADGLLLEGTGSDQKAVAAIQEMPHTGCQFPVPVIRLFPRRIPVYPQHVDVVERLLGAGLARLNPEEIADPARRDLYAKAQSWAQQARVGIWAGPDDQLIMAAIEGDAAEVERLLTVGASPNAPANMGKPVPLVVAVKSGQPEVVELLLRHGAKINALDPAGNSVLCSAAADPKMTRLLLDRGADPNGAGPRAGSPLAAAVMAGSMETIGVLLDHGANVNGFLAGPAHHAEADDTADAHGDPILFWPVLTDNIKVAQVLLERGADPNCRNTVGKSPCTVAREHASSRSGDMQLLLRKYGAKD